MKSFFRDLLGSRPLEIGWLRPDGEAWNCYYDLRFPLTGEVTEAEGPVRGQLLQTLKDRFAVVNAAELSSVYAESFTLLGEGGSFFVFVSVRDEEGPGVSSLMPEGSLSESREGRLAGSETTESAFLPAERSLPDELLEIRIDRGRHPLTFLCWFPKGRTQAPGFERWLAAFAPILPYEGEDGTPVPEETLKEGLRKTYFQTLISSRFGLEIDLGGKA